MPLAEMYRTMLEATNPATWETNRQKQLMGEYELESKRRAMEAEQQLRQLYAENPNPSFGAAAAIDPAYAQKMQQFQNEQLLKQMQTQDLMQKQQEYQAKTYAQYMGPLADTYFDDVRSGMKPEMALQKFRSAVGSSQKELEEKHGIRPQADFTQFEPKQILDRTTGLGVPSRHYKALEEEEKTRLGIQMKQTPGAGELQQEYVLAPDGVTWMPKPNPYRQPLGMPSGAAPSPYPEQAPYQFTTPGGQAIKVWDLGSAAETVQSLPEGPEKEAAAKWLDEQWSSKRNPQKPKTKQELEIETATGKKKAELQVEGEHEAEQQLSTLKALDAQNVESLIDKSFHSKPEAMAKGEYGLSGMAGMPTEANTAYKELVVIEAQMRDMAKAIVGAGPISEGEQKIIKDALGGVSTPGDATSRKSAYRKFVDLAKAKISRYPHLAQQMKAIEDMASKETATPTEQPSGKSLKIGDIDEGMEYLGGNPNSASSWKKVK